MLRRPALLLTRPDDPACQVLLRANTLVLVACAFHTDRHEINHCQLQKYSIHCVESTSHSFPLNPLITSVLHAH